MIQLISDLRIKLKQYFTIVMRLSTDNGYRHTSEYKTYLHVPVVYLHL